jgi:hypothetical protein
MLPISFIVKTIEAVFCEEEADCEHMRFKTTGLELSFPGEVGRMLAAARQDGIGEIASLKYLGDCLQCSPIANCRRHGEKSSSLIISSACSIDTEIGSYDRSESSPSGLQL